MQESQLPVLDEIFADLALVSEVDVKRAERELIPTIQGETEIGTLHSMEMRRLWALARSYAHKGEMATTRAKFECDTEFEETKVSDEAERFEWLKMTVLSLFWAQVRRDMPAWGVNRIDLRADFMVVEKPDMPNRANIVSLLGRLGAGPEGIE